MLDRSGFARRDLWIVVLLFAASRLLYAWLGLEFDVSTLTYYMQFIDIELLKHRLLESLWYYHANPPLLNLFAGIGLKLFGEQASLFYAIGFHLLGLSMALSVYALTLLLSGARPAAIVATALLVFSPTFVLHENWLMYTFPATTLLTVSAWVLFRFVASGRTRWGVAFCSVLAVLLLTRSLFHLGWMILVVALLTACLWERRRQVLFAALAPVLIVALWYGKNYYLFGTFSSSTWMGIGLSNIATLVPTREELRPLVEDGRLTPWALVSRYEQIDQLFNPQRRPPTGIPVLDQVKKSTGAYNFNNQQLIDIDRYYTHDAVTVVRTFPYSYVLGLRISNQLFFSPSSLSPYFTKQNLGAVAPMERIFVPLLHGTSTEPHYVRQPHYGPRDYMLTVNTSIPLIVAWVLVLGYGYMQARTGVLGGNREQRPRAIVIGFIVMSVLYIYAVGTLLELAENYRYRFMTEPLFFVLTATAVTSLVRVVRVKISGARAGTSSPAAGQ